MAKARKEEKEEEAYVEAWRDVQMERYSCRGKHRVLGFTTPHLLLQCSKAMQ